MSEIETRICFVCKGTRVFDGKPCGMCYGTGVDPLLIVPEFTEIEGVPTVAATMMHRARNSLARLRAFQTLHDGVETERLNEEIGRVERELAVIENLAKASVTVISDTLLKSWDEVSAAINRMVVAQPSRMTEASERLREAQKAHQELIIQESRRGG